MNGFARREFLGGAIAGLGLMGLPAGAQAQATIPLPQGAMVLTRKLERQLIDKRTISVTRKWLIQFGKHSGGISINGHQIDAVVDAPSQLAALADIERKRSTDGMFPILLAADGRIIAAGHQEAQADVTRAVRSAETYIAREWSNEGQRLAAKQVLSQLQMASSSLFDNLPPDLFFPNGKPVQNIQPVNLPDGSTGQFELHYEATPATSGSWLHHASRKIVTRLGDSSRLSLEIWSLEPA